MTGQSEITFSIWKMYVKSNKRGETWILPTKEYFTNVISEFKRIKSKFHKIEKVDGEHYTFIVVNSGDIEPRDEFVVNIDSTAVRENPRKKNEVELTKQVFIYYDFLTNLLYISGVRHKKLFEDVLDLKSDEDILIKGIYEDKETFLQLIKSVEEISFKSEGNLFAMLSDKRRTLYDFFETNELEDFTLDLKLKGISKEKIIKFLKSILREQENQGVSYLMIRGKDESNFEYVYNSNSFIKKITILSDKQENYKFNSNAVLLTLREKIREISNEKIKQDG